MRYRMPTGTWWDLSDGIVSTDKVKKKKGNRMKKYIVKKKNGIMGRLLTALLLVILLGTVLLCSGCKTAVKPKRSYECSDRFRRKGIPVGLGFF